MEIRKTGMESLPGRRDLLNNREWVREALAHRETEAVPFHFSFCPPARQLVEHCYGGAPIEDVLGFPIRMKRPGSIKPIYASPREFGEEATDEFGVRWTTSDRDRGIPLCPRLPDADLSGYTFPDAGEASRFEGLDVWCRENEGHYRIFWVGEIWERATFVRGMENILTDLVFHPEFVSALLRGITDYVLQTMEILFERYQFEGVALSDDYGTQRAMLMSPADWRSFVRPLVSEVYSCARRHQRTVFHHSCGNIYPVIGDLVDLGLDILHPIQPEAMDIRRLKREFGSDLTLCGGLRTQDLLPGGTPDEVRGEVSRLQLEMGRGGGYILETGVTIQADVPLENLTALLDQARRPAGEVSQIPGEPAGKTHGLSRAEYV